MLVVNGDGFTIIDTPEGIQFARLVALKAMLKLEMLGMRRGGRRSAYAILKGMGYAGSKAEILAAVEADIEKAINDKKGAR